MVDRIPWDEADTKVKSLIYLSLGAEARRTYHQKNPHTQIEKCTTNELAHELSQETPHLTDLNSSNPCNNHMNHSRHFTAE